MILAFLEEDLKDLQNEILISFSKYETLVKTDGHLGDDNEKKEKISEKIGKFMREMRKSLRPKILKMLAEVDWGLPIESHEKEIRIRHFLSSILKQVDRNSKPEDYRTLSVELPYLIAFLKY